MNPSPVSPWHAAFTDSWRLRKRHPYPLWMAIVACAVSGMGVGAGFVLLAALLSGHFLDTRWWLPSLELSMELGGLIALMCLGSFRVLEAWLPEERLKRLNEGLDSASLLVFVGLPTLCSGLGLWLVQGLLRWRISGVWEPFKPPHRGSLITFLFCGALFAGFSLWRMRSQLGARQVRSQLTEAQLKMLQAQIEPHFLFNTLANIQGLIDYEPAQAKRMLDAFTDYLRASLQQMRAQEVSLGQELDLVRNYLTVMQCRMGERLQTHVEVPEALLEARLPPLLLQPLVENALHHGLEPRLEGGVLQLRARPLAQGLQIDVEDSGIGLARSRERPRRGQGMALQNIRERLLAIYGPAATLELSEAAGGVGTLVRLTLPHRDAFAPAKHD